MAKFKVGDIILDLDEDYKDNVYEILEIDKERGEYKILVIHRNPFKGNSVTKSMINQEDNWDTVEVDKECIIHTKASQILFGNRTWKKRTD